MAGPLPAPSTPSRRAPAGLRDLVQRGRGQHDVLRHPRQEHGGVLGASRPPPTSASWSSCPSRSRTSAASPASTTDSARSWTRSSHSGRGSTPSGSSCRARSRPTDLGTLAGFLRRLPRAYSYAVEVRHRAFFDDPRVGTAAGKSPAPTPVPSGSRSTPPRSSRAPDQRRRTRRVDEEAARAPPLRGPHRPADRPLPRPGRHRRARSRAGSPGSTWSPTGCAKAAPRPSSSTPRTTPTRLTLARRFHDDVRARLPELGPPPGPPPHRAPDPLLTLLRLPYGSA